MKVSAVKATTSRDEIGGNRKAEEQVYASTSDQGALEASGDIVDAAQF